MADSARVSDPAWGWYMRRTPPFTGGESAPFMLWNRNKRSVALDLKSAGNLAMFKAMAAVADILIGCSLRGVVAGAGAEDGGLAIESHEHSPARRR